MTKKKANRLGDLLVEHRVLTKKQLKQALEEQSRDTEGRRLGRILVDLNYVGEETLISFLAKQCGIPHLKLGEYEIDSEVIKYVSPELVAQYQAVPIDKLGKILTVAMVDPLDDDAKDGLGKATGFVVKPIVCSERDIDEAIERYYGAGVLEASREHRRTLSGSGTESSAGGEGGTVLEESLEGLRPLKPYTFEEFVIGHANQFTYATAKAVAEAPAQDYNPLFIYSGVGLGKTHLINAIGNHVLERDPGANVIYLSSERFTAELVGAIQRNDIKSFRKRYREVDVLLLDDIHFLAGKERAQEEFFHTFNELYNAHKQIVATSDRPPKSMLTLEKRLRSRFEGGIITDIQPPEFETRLAILHKKMERLEQPVDDSVLELLAERITGNIRELEGALRGVLATGDATGEKITVSFAERVLDDILGESEAISKQREIEEEIRDAINKADARLQDVLEAGVEEENPDGVEYVRSQLEVASQALNNGDLNGARSAAMDARERAVELLKQQEESRKVRARERLEVSIRQNLGQLQTQIDDAEKIGLESGRIEEFRSKVMEIEAELIAGGDLVPAETQVNQLIKKLSSMVTEAGSKAEKTKEASPMTIEWELTAIQAEIDRLAAMAKGRVNTKEAEKLLSQASKQVEDGENEKAQELVNQAREIADALKESIEGESEEPQKVDAEQAVKSASDAIETARDEGAADLASEKLDEAEDLLINAEAMLEAEEFDEALAYALRAEEAAQEAMESAFNQKLAMRRTETEENFEKVSKLAAKAIEVGASDYADRELQDLQSKEMEIRSIYEDDHVEEAFDLSKTLLKDAEQLIKTTEKRKTEALRNTLGDQLANANAIVKSSKSRGAAKYCPDELKEIERLLADGKKLLDSGDLEKGLEITADLPGRAQKLADKTTEAREAEDALRKKTKETLDEVESILQGALAAGALRYALKPFQEAQVLLAKAHELVDGEDPNVAYEESQNVYNQAQKVIEAIEKKKVEEKQKELSGLVKDGEKTLDEAQKGGAEKYAPTLFSESQSVLSSIRAALDEERYDDGLALKGQLQELIKQTRMETDERRKREEEVRNNCIELIESAKSSIAEAERLEADRYAPDQLKQANNQIEEVNKLLDADDIENAKLGAETAMSLAESLLSAVREERSAEMRSTLEGFVETLGEMLALIVETGGKRYAPDQLVDAEQRLATLRQYLDAGQYMEGLEAAEPLETELLSLQEETENLRQQEEELRASAKEKLGQADEILADALTEGAEEYAGESLKNVQALNSRAKEMSRSDDARKAHELAVGVLDRAKNLLRETKVRKADALRSKLSELVTDLHRSMAEARSKEIGRYAPDSFKKAQELVRNMEAALRSQDFNAGIAIADDAKEALDEAINITKSKKEEEARLRKESETRLSEAARVAMQAENEGAKTYASESLANYRRTVQGIKDSLVRGEIEKAHESSTSIESMAAALLDETITAKNRAMRQQIVDGMANADKMIEEAEELGAARFVADELTSLKELRDDVARLMENDELSAGVERVESLLHDADRVKKEAAKRKKDEEDFRNRVGLGLERAEQAIKDASEAGVVGKELKKAEVLLLQAKRAQEATQMEKSLKFSSLATRKAMDLMTEIGAAVPSLDSIPEIEVSPSKETIKTTEKKKEPEISEDSLPSLRPTKSKAKSVPQTRGAETERKPADPKAKASLEKDFPLIADMTFERYQVGDVNRFTYQTAQAVAESPGTAMYNPLFIHGSVGVGKTHLMTATGWMARDNNAEALVIYMSSEKFANALVEAIEMDAVEELRNKLSMVDVLLIDDIQFMAGRERAQEDFVHIFNILVNQNRQVIISSDRPPSELTTLEDRLRSKFETGFVTDLQLPEAGIREKILKQQIEREGLDIGDEVIKLIAEHINTNLRELQGSLKKLVAHCRLTDSPINTAAAAEVLRSIMPDVKIDVETDNEETEALTDEEQALLEEERRLLEEEARLLAEEAQLADDSEE